MFHTLMYRAVPKLVVLIAIGLIVAAIYQVTRGGGAKPEPNVVYIDMGARTPPAPAP